MFGFGVDLYFESQRESLKTKQNIQLNLNVSLKSKMKQTLFFWKEPSKANAFQYKADFQKTTELKKIPTSKTTLPKDNSI